jgi:hypothetical protein
MDCTGLSRHVANDLDGVLDVVMAGQRHRAGANSLNADGSSRVLCRGIVWVEQEGRRTL